jgi:hypothetical protein
MAGYQGSVANRNSLSDAVSAATHAERVDIWTSLPGRLVSFDPATQRATVETCLMPRHNGKAVPMTQLKDVPVEFPRGGGFAMTWPLQPGDGGQVTFQARDIGAWEGGQAVAPAPTARMHDLSDAVFRPGLEPKPAALTNYNTENFEIRSLDGQTKIEISDQGTFAFQNASEELMTIIDEILRILIDQQANVTFGSSKGLHPITTNSPAAALRERFRTLKLR